MIKFLYLNGTEFKAESLVEFDEKYNTKLEPAEQNKVCLIRFDKEHRFENFHAEKVEDKQRYVAHRGMDEQLEKPFYRPAQQAQRQRQQEDPDRRHEDNDQKQHIL